MNKRRMSLMLTLTMVVSLFSGMTVTASAAGTETYVPLDVTGFNYDVVVESDVGNNGLGNAATPFDGINKGANWALYEADTDRNGGLPSNGIIGGGKFVLESYTKKNSLQLYTSTDASTAAGSLNFVNQTAYPEIAFLGAGGNGAAKFNAVITYTDGAKSGTLTATAPDWYLGSYSGFKDGPFGRIKIKADGSEALGTMQRSGGPNLYAFKIETDPAKAIKSIDFTFKSQGNNERLNIMAVSGVIPAGRYTVSYDANVDKNTVVTGSMVNVAGVPAGTFTLAENKFVREDVTFLGWSTSKDGSSGIIQSGETITISGDTTLYAQWNPVVADLNETDKNITVTAAGDKVMLDVPDDEFIYYMYTVPVREDMDADDIAKYIDEMVKPSVGKEILDAAELNMADEGAIYNYANDIRLWFSEEEMDSVTEEKINSEVIVIVVKMDPANVNHVTYGSDEENPYCSGTEAYAYAVYGVYAEVVGYNVVSGKVLDDDGNPVAGAVVKLKDPYYGTTVTVVTDENGEYSFRNVKDGQHTLEIKYNGKTVKTDVTVEEDVAVDDTAIPTKVDVNSTIKVVDGTPAVAVSGLDEEAKLVMQEAVKKASGGTVAVDVTMTVEAKEADDVKDTERTAIETAAESQEETLIFLDIKILKTVSVNGSGSQENITETKDLLKIVIPFETEGKKDFKVFRYHGGDVQMLTESANADGEKIVVGDGQITVYAKYFSTYAITYSKDTGSNSGSSRYEISYPAAENGKVTISRNQAYEGSEVMITVTPDEGYALDKLTVTDRKGNELKLTDKGDGIYTFKMPSGKVTIDAKFVQVSSGKVENDVKDCAKDGSCPIHNYTDTSTAQWYHDGVHYCLEKGLMVGFDDNLFVPDGTTTRAQLVSILWRLEGKPMVAAAEDFNDVPASEWYYDAICWGTESGIAKGYGEGYFGPSDTVSHEQMVSILWRYAQYKGMDVSVGEETNILSYGDVFDVSEYAIPAMQWACGADVVNGMADLSGNMILNPQGGTTRVQMATMMMRFCEEI